MTTAGHGEVPLFQIGEVAEETGLSIRTIRWYDEVGLVAPSGRSPGGFRLYTDGDVARLEAVKAFKPLDFSLEETREVMAFRDRLDRGETLTGEELGRFGLFAELARARCAVLRERLRSAEALSQALVEASDRARRASRRSLRRR